MLCAKVVCAYSLCALHPYVISSDVTYLTCSHGGMVMCNLKLLFAGLCIQLHPL